MNTKFYLLSALIGGIVIFAWGAFAHMAIPFWEDVMHELPNEQAVVDALKSSGASDGMYYGMQGLFLVSFLGRGMSAEGEGMGRLMAIEFVSDLLVALVLAWLLARTSVRGTLKLALYAAMLGVFGWISINVSYWNWYNFPFAYIVLEAVDAVIGVFLAGWVIGWLMNKTAPAAA